MRKNNMYKTICFLLSLLCLMLPMGVTVCATTIYESAIISSSECHALAEYWISIYYDDDTIVDEIVPIFNGTEICSYCVSFSKNGDPNGYIVVDSNRNAVDNVVEFCLSGKGIYETLCENYGKVVDAKNGQKAIYSTGLFDYAIAVNDEETAFYNSTHELLDKATLTAQCDKTAELKREISRANASKDTSEFSIERNHVTYSDGFFTSGTITSEGPYTPRTILNAYYFTPSTMSDYLVGTFSGNCTPTAAANLISYYKENRGFSYLGTSRQDIYNRIVSESGWNQNGNAGMSLDTAKRGIRKVVNDANYTFSATDYLVGSWSSWKRDLGNNYPVLTAVYGYRQDNSGNWITVGHTIVAIGYREYTSGAVYLQVYDGWNRTCDKYIYFNANYFTSIEGICIKVTN